MKKNWVLTQEAFDAFLNWLSSDREEAARKYEKIRLNLIVLFDYRGCESPDLLADEVINRVAERLLKTDEAKQVQSLQFIYGVARHLYLEEINKRKPINIDDTVIASEPDSSDDGDRNDCMKDCLQRLEENDRRLVIEYYSVDKETKFSERQKIAANHGLGMSNLRVKIKRIREKLQNCRKKCLSRNNL
ncbi:MAG: hypothetical protein LUM44_05120 [Pyrinomonadaceae bacterium]|nr:hypothetical protein [Pyrinomonadaceae bacterium]